MADLVIGSGPAGISVARALLARGRIVDLLDAGAEPGPGVQGRLQKMSDLSAEALDTEVRAAWMAPQFSAPDGEVRRYGSGFAMEPGDNTFAEGADWFALRASRAVGGLSNYWGAAVLPYRQEDIDDWPVTADDLAPHYRAVADWMPISGRQDDLAPLFPAFGMATAQAIAPTTQAEGLLSRLTRKGPVLADMGVQAGMARQAVDPSCRACGLCLHGCPWSCAITRIFRINRVWLCGRSGKRVRGFWFLWPMAGHIRETGCFWQPACWKPPGFCWRRRD